ncbi:hypothetical protein OEG84_08070 [Hoeflea sp. G2-23]|uniref:HlyD family secretion protein n=1 Tax=Hoeflea algicola TaxID=2983763 RepID=A0ABT3Z7C7_9HYPH|nr:hypothetical protein [Hoeflea algicola]MCY0147672.1 hypothetical protein [Hoeflea algicola]
MNKPIDPISVRQARQGKPVLAILSISLALAIVAGWALWGAFAAENGNGYAQSSSIIVSGSANSSSQAVN